MVGQQIAFALTVYALNAHIATEANPFSDLVFSLPQGVAILEAIQLTLTFSISTQSVYAWRAGVRDRGSLISGWVSLIVWALLVSVDTIHDTGVLLMR